MQHAAPSPDLVGYTLSSPPLIRSVVKRPVRSDCKVSRTPEDCRGVLRRTIRILAYDGHAPGGRAILTITEKVAETRPGPLGRSILSSRLWVAAAAAIPALLYLLYVYHYSVNAPYIDDWSVMPIVDSALHGHST